MTSPVFLVEPDGLAHVQVGAEFRLTGPEGRHAVSVVRTRAGEMIELVDGCGRRVEARTTGSEGKDCLVVEVVSIVDVPHPALTFSVVQALPKADRGELAVELMTEVGVDTIIPWAADRCISQWKGDRAERSWRKWRDTATAATKQSRRTRLPRIEPLSTTSEICDRVSAAAVALLLDEEAALPISQVPLPSTGDVVIIVGPEGGVSESERSVLISAGAQSVRMGPTVMRTSTAGVAALSALMYSSGRWSSTSTFMGG